MTTEDKNLGPLCTRGVSIDFSEDDLGERCIKGYASIFNEKDSHGDVMMPGCFDETIKNELPKGRIKFLHHHGWQKPLGLPDVLKPDEKGLWSEAKVIETTRGDEALIEARAGVVDGLSIGFWTQLSQLVDAEGNVLDESNSSWLERWTATRQLLKVKLGEYSLVTFPSAENARVEEVRMRRRISEAEYLKEMSSAHPINFGMGHLAELVQEVRELRAIVQGAPVGVKSPAPPESLPSEDEKDYSGLSTSLDALNKSLADTIERLKKV